MKSFLLAFFASVSLLHAQNNVTINGTSGTNSTSTSYSTDGGLNLSLGFFADYLVVGGGGGGGGATSTLWGAGGGGAGGLLQGATNLVSSNYSVRVGAGGAGGANSSTSARWGQNGTNSVFGAITSVGGGGGAAGGNNTQYTGNAGGSGGGGGGGGNNNTSAAAGGTASAGQGASGGASVNNTDSNSNGSSNNRWAGGGGGGAGSAGTRGNQAPGNSGFAEGGDGGSGASISITGSSVAYAGGGGGGAVATASFGSPSNIAGTGGAGGGGNGGAGDNGSSGANGVNGRGGGGGGAASSGTGGNGGSGVVIVRYQGASLGNIGGTVTSGTGTATGYTIHTFTSTGITNFNMSGVNMGQRLGATLSGNLTGSGGVTYNGPGRLSLTGNNSYTGSTAVNAGELNVNGSIASSTVSVASGASLSGSGSVGAISGSGAINPGNSPGILTAPSVDASGGLSFNFEFTSLNPTYSNATASLNDVLRLTGEAPFVPSLTSANAVNLYFNVPTFENGQVYTGGFFTDEQADFLAKIVDATFTTYVADANGSIVYGGQSYSLLGDGLSVSVSTTSQTANFAGGTVTGRVMQVQAVPEPSTYALLALAAAGLGAHLWRRRR